MFIFVAARAISLKVSDFSKCTQYINGQILRQPFWTEFDSGILAGPYGCQICKKFYKQPKFRLPRTIFHFKAQNPYFCHRNLSQLLLENNFKCGLLKKHVLNIFLQSLSLKGLKADLAQVAKGCCF